MSTNHGYLTPVEKSIGDFRVISIKSNPKYKCDCGSQRFMIYLKCPNVKVGGWDARKKHWYVSQKLGGRLGVCARKVEDLMREHGFERREETSGHWYWRANGADKTPCFEAIVEAMTKVPIR